MGQTREKTHKLGQTLEKTHKLGQTLEKTHKVGQTLEKTHKLGQNREKTHKSQAMGSRKWQLGQIQANSRRSNFLPSSATQWTALTR